MDHARLIIFHKQSSSARTLFLRLGYGGVCAFEPLPRLAVVMDHDHHVSNLKDVVAHPAPLVQKAVQWLNLPSGSLEIEPFERKS